MIWLIDSSIRIQPIFVVYTTQSVEFAGIPDRLIGWMYKGDGFEDGKAFQAKKTLSKGVETRDSAAYLSSQGMFSIQSLSQV